jgi:hypothetical protein
LTSFHLQKTIVPNLQNIIIVLLKLLLATVTPYNGSAATTNGNNNDNNQEKTNSSAEHSNSSQHNDIEEADTKRNHEITAKAVSGILLLLLQWTKLSRMYYLVLMLLHCLVLPLKWFFADHFQRTSPHRVDVLKFENVSQLLVDSGCLLLILKILGLQDMSVTLPEQSDGQEHW